MLRREDAAFVLVDVQGKLAQLMFEKDVLFHNLKVLIQGLQILEVPTVWLEQYPEGLGPTISEVSDLLPELDPIAKVSFSACGQDAFLDQMRTLDRKQVLIAGIEAHICVYQTTRDLLGLGYEVEIVADAVSSRTPRNLEIALEKMSSLGAGATSVEMALFELLKEANTDEFRKVVKLVK